MADPNVFPIDDIVSMASVTGYSMFEIETYWTDALLAAKMSEYYEGSLTQIVNPSQAIRPEDVDVLSMTLAGSGADIMAALGEAAAATKGVVSTIPSLLRQIPLLLAVAAGIGIYILSRKA